MRKATRQKPNKQQQAPGPQSPSGLNLGVHPMAIYPAHPRRSDRPPECNFAVLLPMFPFVLWHNELIFNHSEEEWAYFFPGTLADPAARTGRIDRPSDRAFQFSSAGFGLSLCQCLRSRQTGRFRLVPTSAVSPFYTDS